MTVDVEVGDIYGFPFIYPPKSHVQTHPGIVIAVKRFLNSSVCDVIALSMSHKDMSPFDQKIDIPLEIREECGLDNGHQSISFDMFYQFQLPKDMRKVGSSSGFMGRAPKSLRDDVLSYFQEMKRCGQIRKFQKAE